MHQNILINNDNTTFCLGYWYVKERKLKKTLDHYLKYLPQTLDLLKNQKIVFYYDEDFIIDIVKKNIQTENFIAKRIPIHNLPTFQISENYLQSCINLNIDSLIKINSINEKGIFHYKRDHINSSPVCYRKLFTIWSSKLFLIEQTFNENLFDSDYFAWSDVSISRFKEKRKNWNFMKQIYSNNYIYHFDSVMRYYGKKLDLNASFLFGAKNVWIKFIREFKKKLDELKDTNYAHDEETIISTFYKDLNIFKKINEWEKDLKDQV